MNRNSTFIFVPLVVNYFFCFSTYSSVFYSRFYNQLRHDIYIVTSKVLQLSSHKFALSYKHFHVFENMQADA